MVMARQQRQIRPGSKRANGRSVCWFSAYSGFRSPKPTPLPAQPVHIGRDASVRAAQSAFIVGMATAIVAQPSCGLPMAHAASGAPAFEFAADGYLDYGRRRMSFASHSPTSSCRFPNVAATPPCRRFSVPAPLRYAG